MVWKKPMVPSADASVNRWIGRPLRYIFDEKGLETKARNQVKSYGV